MIFSGGPDGAESSSAINFGRTFNPLKNFNNFSYTVEQNSFTERSLNEAIIDGICQLTTNGGNWDLKILKDCSFLLNKNLKATIFMVGGGSSGGSMGTNFYRYSDTNAVYEAWGGCGGNGGYYYQLNDKEFIKNDIITVNIGLGGSYAKGNDTTLIINNNNDDILIAEGGEYSGGRISPNHNITNIGKGGDGQLREAYHVLQTVQHDDDPNNVYGELVYSGENNTNSNMDGQQGVLYHGNYYGAGGGGGGANRLQSDGWARQSASYGNGGSDIGGDGGIYSTQQNNNHVAEDGALNTGSGGGGGYTDDNTSNTPGAPGTGGSGIVIISNYQ